MGERHKHYDVIVAWAAGEEIEVKMCFANGHEGQWEPFKSEDAPFFNSWRYEYRIKPKIVKREGWVNVYPSGIHYGYDSRSVAEANAGSERITCIRIEWEEEA